MMCTKPTVLRGKWPHALVAACVTAAGLLTLAGVPTAMAQQTAFPTAGGPVVHQMWNPGVGDAAIPRPNHPPIDQIPPMPMPQSRPATPGLPAASSTVTFHDAATGRTIELPAVAPSGATGGTGVGFVPEGLPIEDDISNAFSNLTVATGLTSWPASGNTKMVMRFVDQGGTNRFFVGSGSMQDSGMILTAAHVVYARNPNGLNIFNWASEIWVYPAWDGNGGGSNPPSDQVTQNWGMMYSTSYLAGTNYINNGDFDADIAVVGCFDRSAGMLTGWYGWAWGFACSTIQSRTYLNYSYPAESCSGSLHTGATMYFWQGTFDSCPGNQLQINTTGGCFNAGWGGMSGSGAFYLDGGNRLVHAICSNSNRSTSARYAKLWEQFATDMNNYRNTVRGAGLDIEALRFRSASSVQAGTSLSGATVVVANTSNANPAAQTYTLRAYLSTNNNISSSDTLLGTWTYNVDYAPLQNVTFNVPPLPIPSSVAPGTYWVGVEIDAPGDVDTGNNDTDTWDAQQITVSAAPASNDLCANGIPLTVNVAFFGNNATSLTDGSAACATGNKDVWFSFRPTCSGTYSFNTCGSSFDTILSLHSACTGTTANQLACNDDDFNVHCSGGSIRDSYFEANLTANTTYRIRLAAFGSAPAGGNYRVHVGFNAPANNDCGNAENIGLGTTAFNSCGATTDGPDEPGDCTFFSYTNIGNDLWYRVVTPAGPAGSLRVSTCGSAFDTKIAIYNDLCPVSPGFVLACNDDAGGNGSCPFTLQSFASAPATASTGYLIRVGGYNAAVGAGVINVEFVPSSPCGTADFDGDGDAGTDSDIEAFFACLAGTCCSTCFSADFDGDGDTGTDSDIEAFFRVLAGQPC